MVGPLGQCVRCVRTIDWLASPLLRVVLMRVRGGGGGCPWAPGLLAAACLLYFAGCNTSMGSISWFEIMKPALKGGKLCVSWGV